MVCTACHGLRGLPRQLMDPVSSTRGLGVGMALCQIEATHFKGLVEDPGAFQWKRIPLSPTWMTYDLIETWL